MPFTVQDILDIIEKIAPASLAEEWDNVGLMVGDPHSQVDGVLLGLDPTLELLSEAISSKANLLLTHHPFIFHPLYSVSLNTPDGVFVEHAIRNRINVIACHTNYDCATEGVSHALARRLGLEDIGPLLPHATNEQCGMGCIGSFQQPVTPEEMIDKLRSSCSPPYLLATSNRPDSIDRVAVCGGSGSEIAPLALESGAQVYITSEVKHSTARWAEQAGLWIVDAGHYATENQALPTLARRLAEEASGLSATINIEVTQQQPPPLTVV